MKWCGSPEGRGGAAEAKSSRKSGEVGCRRDHDALGIVITASPTGLIVLPLRAAGDTGRGKPDNCVVLSVATLPRLVRWLSPPRQGTHVSRF